MDEEEHQAPNPSSGVRDQDVCSRRPSIPIICYTERFLESVLLLWGFGCGRIWWKGMEGFELRSCYERKQTRSEGGREGVGLIRTVRNGGRELG